MGNTPRNEKYESRRLHLKLAALLGLSTAVTPSTPFFRFPHFEMSEYSLDYLAKRDIVVFGADFWAEDRIKMPPEALLKGLIDSVEAAGKGILLLHDSREQTAAVLPDLVRYLRDNRYRVVHVVRKASAKAATDIK